MASVKKIRALSRGLAVLRTLETVRPLTLHDLSRRTELAKATLLRILATLEAEGYVRRGLADQLYHLNVRAAKAPDQGWKAILAEVAGAAMDRLCHEVLWPSDLGIYEDGAIRVQETSRRLSPFVMNRDVLSHRIHVLPSAMGRAFLAWSSDATKEEVLLRLRRSPSPHDRLARNRTKVEALLAETRARGFGSRHAGYFITHPREASVSAIAVPVRRGGTPIGAVNLAWVTSALSEKAFVDTYLPRLSAAALEISTALDARLGDGPSP